MNYCYIKNKSRKIKTPLKQIKRNCYYEKGFRTENELDENLSKWFEFVIIIPIFISFFK